MSKWIPIVLALLAACSKEMPQTCVEVLDCCSSIQGELEDPNLRSVKFACDDAKRFADERSGEKCSLARHELMLSFRKAYPTKSMGPTCERK